MISPAAHRLFGRRSARLVALCALALGLSAAARPAPADPVEIAPVRAFRDFNKKTWPALPASTAVDLVQDERGILWIATLDGLAYFDGRRLRGLDGVPGAPGFGAVSALAGREQGGLYAAGINSLHVFDQQRWRSLPAPGGTEALARMAGGGGLARLDRAGGLWLLDADEAGWRELPRPDAGERVRALAAEADGSLLAATRRALFRRRGDAWSPASPPIPASEITALLVAFDGRRWVATQSGELFTSSDAAPAWARQDTPAWAGRVRKLEQDRRGRIWAGGLHGGLISGFAGQPFQLWTGANGLHEEGVVTLLADREGTLWISFNGRGLQQWLGEAWTHRNSWRAEQSQRRLSIFGITKAPNGGFYAAVNNRGLWHWDGEKLHEYGADHGLVEHVRYAYAPEPGKLWVAGRFGIWERAGQGAFERQLTLPAGFVYAILPAPDGEPHAITSAAGILRHRGGVWAADEAWNATLPSTHVRALLWRGAHILVGTVAGLGVYDRAYQPAALPWRGLEHLPESVNALLDVGDGVWIGGYGLSFCADATGECRRIDPALLPGRTVYALARATDGALWVGGSAGVGRLAGDGRWTSFDAGNGLIEDECNHFGLLPQPGGAMLVGTMASLARFDAGVQPLAEAELRLFWRQPDQPLPAGAGERSVDLAWQAPWLLPQKVEYRLRLPHRSPDWWPPQLADERLFDNLEPGDWQIEVQARRAGQSDWSAPIRHSVNIEPRLTEKPAFYLVGGLLLLAALAAVVRLRTRRLDRRARELQRAVDNHVANLKMLRGLLPICASCKKVRNDGGAWQQIESYVREHSEAEFSHGYCPECFGRLAQALDHLASPAGAAKTS